MSSEIIVVEQVDIAVDEFKRSDLLPEENIFPCPKCGGFPSAEMEMANPPQALAPRRLVCRRCGFEGEYPKPSLVGLSFEEMATQIQRAAVIEWNRFTVELREKHLQISGDVLYDWYGDGLEMVITGEQATQVLLYLREKNLRLQQRIEELERELEL